MASRLCKAAMLSRFNLVAKEAQREELLIAVTYREAKVMQSALFTFRKGCMICGKKLQLKICNSFYFYSLKLQGPNL